jgi:hypothetical protein
MPCSNAACNAYSAHGSEHVTLRTTRRSRSVSAVAARVSARAERPPEPAPMAPGRPGATRPEPASVYLIANKRIELDDA